MIPEPNPLERMKPSLALAPLLALAAACSGTPDGSDQPNHLSRGEERAGYELLFDGESTEHWRGWKKDAFPEGWIVEDGALARVESGGAIVTRETYGSFELALEWKISPGGNSGIFWHVVEDPAVGAPWQTAPEMQVLDDAAHPGLDAKNAAGACYDLYPVSEHAAAPVGEWNRVRIRVEGDHVQQWLNDVLVCEYTMGSDDWNRRVQACKFANEPYFAKSREGHIALQDHGDPVWYRNLRIRRL